MRGEIRLNQGNLKLAEVDFHNSLAMAPKAWELRTTMSQAGLPDGKRDRDEARTMLADGWFTEGFDIPT
jgi:hypothetical protein